jgi:hypothetical protein
MGWYRVIKTIKGHRYVYEQRTRREGKHVRTENRYIGPTSEGGAAGERIAVTTTPRTLYHGSREGIDGPPRASGEGIFGPGFYLTHAKRAGKYATLDGKDAANPDAWNLVEPSFDGTVHAVEIGHLNLKAMTWDEFHDRCEPLTEHRASTPAAKAKLQELLAAEGYDGLEIRDTRRPEVVVFPSALHKIELRAVTTTQRPGMP